jgi:hypothetical protein
MNCISLTAASSTSRSSPTWPHAPLWMTSSGQPPLGRGPERLHHTVHRQAGDLMVVANVGDSQVVLGTASDDGAITAFNSSSTWSPTCHVSQVLIGHEFLCTGMTAIADVVWVSSNMMYVEELRIGGATTKCTTSLMSPVSTSSGSLAKSDRDSPCRSCSTTTISKTVASSQRRRWRRGGPTMYEGTSFGRCGTCSPTMRPCKP